MLINRKGVEKQGQCYTGGDPIPTWETVEDLPANLYQALAEACQEDLNVVINGTSFDPVDPGSPGFEDSPTVLSADSGNGLRASKASGSTETPKGDGLSTATVRSSPGSATTSS